MRVLQLTIQEVQYVAHSLAKELMSWSEPIPEFETRFPNALERCLAMPFGRFDRKDLYKGLVGKAAILFYLLIKNHPFQNGNKRIALTTMMVFLHKNKKWIKVDDKEFYNFAKWVAESNPKLRKETVAAVETFLRTYIVNL